MSCSKLKNLQQKLEKNLQIQLDMFNIILVLSSLSFQRLEHLWSFE